MLTFKRDDFKREADILKSYFTPRVYALLQDLDVTVAGGTLTSLFTNRDINDLDLYFKSWETFEIFIAYMEERGLRTSSKTDLTLDSAGWGNVKRFYTRFKWLDGYRLPGSSSSIFFEKETDNFPKLQHYPLTKLDEINSLSKEENRESYFIRQVGMTDKSVMYSLERGAVLQCIAFDVFKDAQEIFDKFDFTINMGSFSFKDETWGFDKDFLKHLSQRMLIVNPKTDYPIISMVRVGKYQARGFSISRKEVMKLGVACSSLSMTGWEDAKKHLSGMYGANVDTLFTRDDEFSLSALCDVLSSATDLTVDSIATYSEKGKNQQTFSLIPKDFFQILNNIRKHTGRPYFSKGFCVCPANRFSLLGGPGKLSLGATNDSSTSLSTYMFDIFVTEEEARHKYNTNENYVLMSVDFVDTKNIEMNGCDTVCSCRSELPAWKVSEFIETNGDIS